MEIDVDSCVICGNGFEEPLDATTVKRGIPKLIECAKKFGDTNLASHLTKQKNMKPVVGKVLVHEGCRYEYTNPATNIITSNRQSSANSPSIEPPPKKLRSGKNNFNWKRDCFFCCEPVSSILCILIDVNIEKGQRERSICKYEGRDPKTA